MNNEEENTQEKDDELDVVFKEETSAPATEIEDLAIDEERVRYVKNIGLPMKMKIDKQKSIEWYKEDGVKIRLETISDPEDTDDQKKMASYGVNIVPGRKAWLYFYDGDFKSIRETFLDDSFKILSYPHIMNFAIGTNKRDERKYNLLVGNVVKINRSSDVDLLLERFDYLVETDDKGGFNRSTNKYLKSINQKTQKLSETERIDWSSIEQVDIKTVKKHSDVSPVTLEEAGSSEAESIQNS